jgi:hypothetical protein
VSCRASLFGVSTAATKTKDAEGAVRQYLLYLEDPAQLRDDKDLQRKTQAVLEADDPIDKLRAISELERASNIDEAPIRDGFVTHAKTWASEASIPISAFRDLRVPDDVLRAAGFDVPAGKARGRRSAASNGRQRAKAVPVEEIKTFITASKGTFLLSDVMSGVGGSQATVRKAVDELVSAGKVTKLGPVPDYKGRGRAPLQYSHG